jgi:hypothetical protein
MLKNIGCHLSNFQLEICFAELFLEAILSTFHTVVEVFPEVLGFITIKIRSSLMLYLKAIMFLFEKTVTEADGMTWF